MDSPESAGSLAASPGEGEGVLRSEEPRAARRGVSPETTDSRCVSRYSRTLVRFTVTPLAVVTVLLLLTGFPGNHNFEATRNLDQKDTVA